MARDPKVTHKIMAAVKSKDTRPEILLRRSLWQLGLRYQVNYTALPGKPDIVFTRAKLAVFCDGDYWHGHNWALRGQENVDEELAGYSDFWANKIRGNIERDEHVNTELARLGWRVLRVWESDIRKNVSGCAQEVFSVYALAISETAGDP